MKIKLHIWRQKGPSAPGKFHLYEVDDVTDDMSFLEVLDVLNEKLVAKGEEPVAGIRLQVEVTGSKSWVMIEATLKRSSTKLAANNADYTPASAAIAA